MSSTAGLSVVVYGIAVVISFAVAGLIRLIVVILPRIGRAKPEPETEAAPQLLVAVPPAHVAAISAAVACMVEPRHIIHIEDRRRGAVWTAEGRLIHQTSHNVPHGKKQ